MKQDPTFNNGFPYEISVVVTSVEQIAAVYALLGSAAAASDLASGNASSSVSSTLPAMGTESSSVPATSISPEQPGLSPVQEDSGEIDAHGHHWSADLHASTKGKTKEGLWRMKPGATRPDPLPGFPVDDAGTATGTSSETPTPSATLQTATEEESVPTDTSTQEDDEFAAFREAAAQSDATDAAAAAAVPPRTFSDADLGALCNQAAVKLGDPSPIKEIIAQFVPEGEIAHSRNVPEDKRTDFVAAVEAKADIEFAG